MGDHIEKVYYLENPESGIKTIATESEVKFENVIKDIFGVAYIEDLAKMIRYNKKFQENICKANNINENEISIEMVFRLAKKNDLLPIKEQYLEMLKKEQSTSNDVLESKPPFASTIQLHEGIYNWNHQEHAYVKIN